MKEVNINYIECIDFDASALLQEEEYVSGAMCTEFADSPNFLKEFCPQGRIFEADLESPMGHEERSEPHDYSIVE